MARLKSRISRPNIKYLLSLPLAWSLFSSTALITVSNPILAQETTLTNIPSDDPTDPNNLRPLAQSDSLLSLQGGKKLMSEASQAINNQDYDSAAKKLQNARQVFNQLSNFYLQLSDSFSGIENRIAQQQRQKALETGQMRDEATYQLALVHRAQNQPELSVPLLIQIIRSQNPTSELGKKSYQQLFEIGFVEDPFSESSSSR
ncbi:MAG: hypothetical protein QNJ70_06605 [Xenococcaceae cyanobacterium MO_207.B15]|nr:hypothetical protein [Xenococcaceae cyanobacterium MO_207.B15]MDJ0742346.1 hypothetical protein [Xenococcaceae cyanobacterium MO_167.B27]